jgi:hypothetical protein
MTDEKLNECCAATHGIFIKGIMCLMHKSEEYGKIVLKQKDQQTDNTVRNFAAKIQKHVPYSIPEIEAALFELIAEKVVYIEGNSLCQKRMIEDNIKSEVKAKAGKISAETKKTKGKKSVGTKPSTRAGTKVATSSETEYEIETGNESVIDPESYGKSENYFHGPVPADLLEFAHNLQPSPLKSEAWQRYIQDRIQLLGYTVTREVACPYPSEDGVEIEGFIDLQATKNGLAIGIELDNRVTTRDSVVKVRMYPAGMVLLRDPKPAIVLPARPMVTSTTFQDVELWTRDVIANNDEIFRLLLKARKLDELDLTPFAESHLVLVSRYSWFKKWDDQTGFRQSLIGHIVESLAKAPKPYKGKHSIDEINLDHIQ